MAERSVFRGSDTTFTTLRRLAIGAAAIFVLAWVGCSTVSRVDAGHVGVRFRLGGSERGVQNEPTVQGWVFFNPLTEQIVQFPTSVINVVWTQSPQEGNPVDESMTFSSNEGAMVNTDVGFAFHIDPKAAPRLYDRFRTVDLVHLANTYIRNEVRDAFNEVSSTLTVADIYGTGKNKLISDVTKMVKVKLEPEGIIIDQLTINGALRLPENVVQGINRALEASQNAQSARNKVDQIKAEAEQAIASATGAAEAARQKATGEADAILIRARAEARANEIIRLSTSPNVLAYRQMERWDGRLPIYSGGGQLPLATIDVTKLPEIKEEDRKKALEAELAADAPPPSTVKADGSAAGQPPAPSTTAPSPAPKAQ